MTDEGFRRKLTAILSADVIGYSRLMREDEEATVRDIAAHRVLIFDIIKQHNGRVVDSPGDNILAEFASVVDAVNGAIKIQQEIKERNADIPEDRRMEFRIGINLGDVIEEEERIYGDGVNIAARVEGLAAGGGIAISGIVYESIKDKLSLGYHYLGEQDVKNIPEPVRVYRLLTEPVDAGKMIVEKKPKSNKLVWAASGTAALLILAVGTIAIWNYYLRPSFEPVSVEKMAFPLPDKPSIAVLPFANMIGDSKQDYICDGISEEIITALSKIPQLFVIARNSSFSYKGKPIKVKQIAEELGVRYILEGAVRMSGNRLRITAQLIDTIRGNHIWSERYERDLKDLFAVQDEISLKILTELGVKLTLGEEARLWAKGTEDIEAYLKVLQGRHFINLQSKESNVIARQMAKEAIALDPDFPTAYTLLGSTHLVDVWLGSSKSSKESLEQAEELYRRAIALDDSYAPAHSALCQVYVHRRLYEEAIAEGKLAVELNPSAAPAYAWLGNALRFAGRSEEAVSTYEKAMRLDPYPSAVLLQGLGGAYHMVGRFEEALKAFKRALHRDPNNMFVHLSLARTYSALDLKKEAQAAAAEVMKIDPEFSLHRFAKILPYKNQVDKDRVISELQKAGLPEYPPLKLPDKPSIAVLPFDNMSGDPNQEYLCNGIADQIINSIANIPNILVIARNSSFAYKSKSVNVQQIARDLGVRYILEGSLQRDSENVRINTQLIDAKTGLHLWAENYDLKLVDIFSVQDEICKNIMVALQVKLTEGEMASMEADTVSIRAYERYLKAREHSARRTKEDVLVARRFAQEAIALDPEYAAAYLQVGGTYLDEIWFGMTKTPSESLARAEEMVQKAISLQGITASVNESLCGVNTLKKDFDKAIYYGEKAVEQSPNNAYAHGCLGMALRLNGQYDEAILRFEKALKLNPIKAIALQNGLAWAYLYSKQYEKAVSIWNKTLERNPDYLFAYMGLTMAYWVTGSEDQARQAAKNVLRINPKFSVSYWEKRSHLKDRALANQMFDAWRKAGLK